MDVPLAVALPSLALLPILIFLAETCVVTLATVRIICIARGRKGWAALLGFFEVTTWLFAIGQVMQNLSDPGCFIGFAGGFSLGNYLGVCLEKRLALGNVVVRVITRKDVTELVENLKAAEYGVTSIDAQGATGPVRILLMVIQRKEMTNVVAMLRRFDSKVFYSVDDLQAATEGIFPTARRRGRAALTFGMGLQRVLS
jgi:uncharacterized protein YebE (UPF0316 family)